MRYKNYADLATFGKRLLTATALEEGLPLIAEYSKEIAHAKRCSVFVYDEVTRELWTTLADGIDKIVIDANEGVVGKAFRLGEVIVVNDVNSSPYFCEAIDKASGFETKNLIATPIFNSKREVIGVLELLNKAGGFDEEDKTFTQFFTNFISGFVELSLLHAQR